MRVGLSFGCAVWAPCGSSPCRYRGSNGAAVAITHDAVAGVSSPASVPRADDARWIVRLSLPGKRNAAPGTRLGAVEVVWQTGPARTTRTARRGPILL